MNKASGMNMVKGASGGERVVKRSLDAKDQNGGDEEANGQSRARHGLGDYCISTNLHSFLVLVTTSWRLWRHPQRPLASKQRLTVAYAQRLRYFYAAVIASRVAASEVVCHLRANLITHVIAKRSS